MRTTMRATTTASPNPPAGRGRFGPFLLLLAVAACGEAQPPSGAARDADTPTDGLLAVNGTELYVERMGNGPPLMVVHGGPLLEHGYLVPFLEPLADRHQLVFFDQRLSGRSAGTVDSASVRVETLVADMEAIRVALGLEEAGILAHSWGAFLALRYALAHPDRVTSLVLVSPMAASSRLREEEEARVAEGMTGEYVEEASRLREDPGLRAGAPDAVAAVLRHSFRLQFHDPARVSELPLYVPPDYLERSRQFGFMREDLSGYDLHDALGELRVPTLIVYGEAEVGADLGGRALAGALPEAELVRIRGAGHFAFLEQPERFQEVVGGFLEGR